MQYSVWDGCEKEETLQNSLICLHCYVATNKSWRQTAEFSKSLWLKSDLREPTQVGRCWVGVDEMSLPDKVLLKIFRFRYLITHREWYAGEQKQPIKPFLTKVLLSFATCNPQNLSGFIAMPKIEGFKI